jgi:uncharacterized protein YbcI
MAAHSAEHPSAAHQSPAAMISNEMVRITRDYTGRGPTKARTYINDDVIVCLLRDALTKGERALVENGEADSVRGLRRKYQDVMRGEAWASVEEIMHRRVVSFMSDTTLEPDLSAEVFVLEPEAADADHPVNGESS